MRRLVPLRTAAFAIASLACGVALSASPPAAYDGQWLLAGHDVQGTRFSGLDQITADNAHALKLVFSFSTGTTHGNEAAPIVVGDTMYIVTPWPNYVFALDLGKPGAPVKWKFDPRTKASAQGVACCDTVNRG